MKTHKNGSCTFVCDNSLTTDYFAQNDLFGKTDLVIVDPPYGIADKGKVTKSHGKVLSNRDAWGDEFQDEFTESEYSNFIRNLIERSFALLSPGGSFFCYIDRKYAGNFTEHCESLGFLYKNMVSFIKVNSVPKLRATNFGSAFELGLWFVKPNQGRTAKGNKILVSKPKIFNGASPVKGLRLDSGQLDIKAYHNSCSSNVFFGNIGSKRTGHATEKYTWQLKPIVECFSNRSDQDGACVVDLCAGGFNSGLVSQELGRQYVGVEQRESFWTVGCDLLDKIVKDPNVKITKEMKIS